MLELTPKQERFVREYLIDLNGTQAAIRSGYSQQTANEQGSRLLAKGHVQARLKELGGTIAEKLGIDAAYVLGGFKKVAERSLQAEAVLDDEGNPIGEYNFNAPGANKALEMLGKHLRLFGEDDKQGNTTIIVQAVKF